MVSTRLVSKSISNENLTKIFHFLPSLFRNSSAIDLLRYSSTLTKAISVSIKPSFGLIVLRYVPPEEVGGSGWCSSYN
jgi:hypothetical protein